MIQNLFKKLSTSIQKIVQKINAFLNDAGKTSWYRSATGVEAVGGTGAPILTNLIRFHSKFQQNSTRYAPMPKHGAADPRRSINQSINQINQIHHFFVFVPSLSLRHVLNSAYLTDPAGVQPDGSRNLLKATHPARPQPKGLKDRLFKIKIQS